MMLATVSFRPSEIATPPTPRAVISVVGLMPNTGCSTIAAPMTQIVTRARFTKIEALGICELSNTLRRTRLTSRSVTSTRTNTMANHVSLPAFAWNQRSIFPAYSSICLTVSAISEEVVRDPSAEEVYTDCLPLTRNVAAGGGRKGRPVRKISYAASSVTPVMVQFLYS